MLECDDHKTNEDVYHEERNDDNKYYIEDGHPFPIVIYRAMSHFI